MTRIGALPSLLVLVGLSLLGSRQAAAGQGAAVAGTPARLPEALVLLPTLEAAIGPTWAVSSSGKVGWAVDATIGAVLGWPGRGQVLGSREERLLKAALWLQPEFGYSYEHGAAGEPQGSGHLGSLGLGIGYGNLMFLQGAYTPRLVIGSVGGDAGGELAVGLRHGVSGHFLGRLFSAELSHQMLWAGGELRHELRLLCGLNAAVLLLPWL